MRRAYTLHLDRLWRWLGQQAHVATLPVRYNELIAQPEPQAARVNDFLGGALDVTKMTRAVDPTLYRNRAGSSVDSAPA